MTADARFFIDGKPFEVEPGPAKVSALLHRAGTSASEAVLVSEEGFEHTNPDEEISIAPGDRFRTRKRDDSPRPVGESIRYSVNGEEGTTIENPLSLAAILRRAGAGAAIDVSDLENYYLQNTADGRKYGKLEEPVTLSDGDNFVAIHVGRTPVA